MVSRRRSWPWLSIVLVISILPKLSDNFDGLVNLCIRFYHSSLSTLLRGMHVLSELKEIVCREVNANSRI